MNEFDQEEECFKVTELKTVDGLKPGDQFLVSHVVSNEFTSEYDSERVSFQKMTDDMKSRYLDKAYAAKNHGHDNYLEKNLSSEFSQSSHNHDGVYAKVSHTHKLSDIQDYEVPDTSVEAYRKTRFVTGQMLDLTMKNEYPVVFFTNLYQSEYDFSKLSLDNDEGDGVYTWEIMCKSKNAVSNVTVGDSDNVKYVGTDLKDGMIDGSPFEAGTTVVFAVRLIRHDGNDTWNVNYCYKF